MPLMATNMCPAWGQERPGGGPAPQHRHGSRPHLSDRTWHSTMTHSVPAQARQEGAERRPEARMPLMATNTYPAWARSAQEVASHHGTDTAAGLTSAQVEEKRRQYGFNELEKAPGKPMWRLVLEQFDDMMVKVHAGLVWSEPCGRE